jgi:hypothetical protein
LLLILISFVKEKERNNNKSKTILPNKYICFFCIHTKKINTK